MIDSWLSSADTAAAVAHWCGLYQPTSETRAAAVFVSGCACLLGSMCWLPRRLVYVRSCNNPRSSTDHVLGLWRASVDNSLIRLGPALDSPNPRQHLPCRANQLHACNQSLASTHDLSVSDHALSTAGAYWVLAGSMLIPLLDSFLMALPEPVTNPSQRKCDQLSLLGGTGGPAWMLPLMLQHPKHL